MDVSASASEELLKCVGANCPVCKETLTSDTKFTGMCGHTICISCFRNQPKRVSIGTPISYDVKCPVCNVLVTSLSAKVVNDKHVHLLFTRRHSPPMTWQGVSHKLLAPVYDGKDMDAKEDDDDSVRKMKEFAFQFLQYDRKDSRWGPFCDHWQCPPIPKSGGTEALVYWRRLVQDFLGPSKSVVKFSTAWFYIWRAAQGIRITYECHGTGHEHLEWRANNIKARIDVSICKVVEKAFEILEYTDKEKRKICGVRVNGHLLESNTVLTPNLLNLNNDKAVQLVLECDYHPVGFFWRPIETRCIMIPWDTKGVTQEQQRDSDNSDEDMPGLE